MSLPSNRVCILHSKGYWLMLYTHRHCLETWRSVLMRACCIIKYSLFPTLSKCTFWSQLSSCWHLLQKQCQRERLCCLFVTVDLHYHYATHCYATHAQNVCFVKYHHHLKWCAMQISCEGPQASSIRLVSGTCTTKSNHWTKQLKPGDNCFYDFTAGPRDSSPEGELVWGERGIPRTSPVDPLYTYGTSFELIWLCLFGPQFLGVPAH